MANTFTESEMEMLNEGGWVGGFIEDIEEGDLIAIKTFVRESEDVIKFITVLNLKKIPRFERDDFGNVLSDYPNFLIRFIGVHDNGLHEPITLGATWGIFRKENK